MNNLLVICGPTATGKTALGIHLARKFSGEIISADSRQVYKGMDIGTGKDLPVNSKLKTHPKPEQTLNQSEARFMAVNRILFWFTGSVQGSPDTDFQSGSGQNSKLQLKTKNYTIGYHLVNEVPIWLLDVVEPDYQFSVADYLRCANLVIKDILKRKKLPILVGGTGFYIKALVNEIETIGIPADWGLRRKLGDWKIEKLQEKLKELAPERWRRMSESDRKNPRRLIRAIEVTQSQPLETINHKPLTINHLLVGLTAPYKVLYQRIDKRVGERVKQGVVNEIKKLLKKGYSWKNSALGETIGYKEFKPYLKGETSLSDAIQKWKYDEHAYARRQMTWFKKALRLAPLAQGIWFDITKKGFEKEIEEEVKKYLGSE